MEQQTTSPASPQQNRRPKQRFDDALHRFEDTVLGAGGMKRDLAFLVISGISIVLSFALPDALPFDWAWVAIVLCGLPIVLEAVIALITEFDVKADVLVSLALISSIAIGEYDAAGIVAFIMQIGGFLEEATVHRARSGLERLVSLTPRTARVIDGNEERVVDAAEVRQGDTVRVLPGETIPADGVVVAGETSIDVSVMTGEPLPVDVASGDEVTSGCVNQLGSIDVRATRVGEDSSFSRMVRLARSADANKAKIVRTADAWATWIVVAALATSAICFAITGEIIRSVTVLVVFCPCALVLATPTAVMAAIGNATSHGFLTREGDALERLAKVTHVAFDKTGTLTHGRPEVVDVVALGGEPGSGNSAHVLELAAKAERRSEHPLGHAIARCYAEREGHEAKPAESFELKLGRGVAACVDGENVAVGNERMMHELGVDVPARLLETAHEHAERGHMAVFVAESGTLVGLIALADTVRQESAGAVAAVKRAGAVPVLLTGDNERAARAVAHELGIDEVLPECLPQDKMAFIEQAEEQGKRVCMIGDGVNDAPALARAYTGVAMGGIGSDIAVESSDIVIVGDSLAELGHLIALSRHTLSVIKLNLTFAMTVNIIATALATLGILGPIAGAVVHNIGSVLVIMNSALLLRWKAK